MRERHLGMHDLRSRFGRRLPWLLLAVLLVETYIIRLPLASLSSVAHAEGTHSQRDVEVDNYFRGSLIRTGLIPVTGEETLTGPVGDEVREFDLDPFLDVGAQEGTDDDDSDDDDSGDDDDDGFPGVGKGVGGTPPKGGAPPGGPGDFPGPRDFPGGPKK